MPGVVTVEITGVGEGITVTEQQLVELVYEESIVGAARFLLHVEVEDEAPWKPLLTDPELRFQIRLKHEQQDEKSQSPRKTVRRDLARVRSLKDFTEILIDGMDAGWDLYQGFTPDSVYKGQRISEIVTTIAERNGLTADVEPTRGRYNLWQCNYPDAWFIRHVLLPRAYTTSRADFLFYVRNGTEIVFRPPDLSVEKAKFTIPPRGDEKQRNVEFHEFDIRDSMLTPLRSLSLLVRAYDPIKREYREFTANDSTVEYKRLASTPPRPTVNPTRALVIPAPFGIEYDRRDVDDMGKAIWSRGMRYRYEVRLSLRGFLAIQPGDVFKIDAQNFLGGRYLCSGVQQKLDPEERDMWTSIYGVRRCHA